ncbi:MAG: hypothetical protein ACOCRO_07555 [Halanaerobiales bacterium]
MKLNEAIKILNCINRKIDPYTGEVGLSSSIFENSKTGEAFDLAIEIMKKEIKKDELKKKRPARTGEKWTDAEERRLSNVFEIYTSNNINIKEIINKLAEAHERSYGAIAARLIKIGKLPPDFNT